jgi:hypothetical protein
MVEAFPDLDGLHYNSRFAGGPCLVLFPPVSDAMRYRPAMSRPLTPRARTADRDRSDWATSSSRARRTAG